MADISQEIQAFQNAVYGEEVRSSMVSAITKINEVNEEGVEVIQSQIQIDEEPTEYTKMQLETTGTEIEFVEKEELDTAISESAVGSEVEDARIGYDGKSYESTGEAVRGQISDLRDELSDVISEVNFIKRFDWSTLGISSYPYGWNSGYYDATDGTKKSSNAFMSTYTGKYIDLTNAKKIRAVPPSGYAISICCFKADGTVTTFGQANTQTHPENIDKVIVEDVEEYVKCNVTVGRFTNSGNDKGNVHCQEEDFVNSVILDIYFPKSVGVKEFYKDEIQTTIASVHDALTEPALVFPLVTDIHYLSLNSNFDDCIENMKAVCESIECDFVLNLGDNTDGNRATDVTMERNLYMLNRFKELGIPYMQAIGNHDLNNYSGGTLLTSQQIWKSYLSNTKNVKFDLTAGEKNFYKDFDELGIRLVVLDANHDATYKYSERTATWLSEVALNTDYIVVLAEHFSSIETQNWNNGSPVNHTHVTNALQAFVNGGGTLIQLCGHSHADYHFTSPWLTVFSTCQKFESNDVTTSQYQAISGYAGTLVSPERTAGTATEDSWSVVVVKPISRTINFIRFGAGEDRTFSF